MAELNSSSCQSNKIVLIEPFVERDQVRPVVWVKPFKTSNRVTDAIDSHLERLPAPHLITDLIAVLIVIQTMFQYSAQCIAVILLRRRQESAADRFRMPLFPLPAIIALLGWVYVTVTGKPLHLLIGAVMLLAGAGVFLLEARRQGRWPFQRTFPVHVA